MVKMLWTYEAQPMSESATKFDVMIDCDDVTRGKEESTPRKTIVNLFFYHNI